MIKYFKIECPDSLNANDIAQCINNIDMRSFIPVEVTEIPDTPLQSVGETYVTMGKLNADDCINDFEKQEDDDVEYVEKQAIKYAFQWFHDHVKMVFPTDEEIESQIERITDCDDSPYPELIIVNTQEGRLIIKGMYVMANWAINKIKDLNGIK